MKSFKYSYIVASFCKITCTGKSGRTGTDNGNFMSVLNFCSGRFDIMLKCIVSNESLQFTDGNSFAFLTADTFALALALLRAYTTADSRKCRRLIRSPCMLPQCSFLICSMNPGMLMDTGHPCTHFGFLQPRHL